MTVNIRYDFGCKLVRGSQGIYRHSFGGDFQYAGTVPKGCAMPLHALFRLDLSDPAVPFTFDGPFRFLPFFFPFHYECSPVCYRVRSDAEIEILELEKRKYLPDFPYPAYPKSFDAVSVNSEPISYEEQRELAMAEFVFQNPWLNPPSVPSGELQRLRRLHYSYARIGLVHDLVQLPRGEPCPNPACENHEVRFCLDTFATIPERPFPDLDLWQADGPTIQIVYEICKLCGCIRTYNTCD